MRMSTAVCVCLDLAAATPAQDKPDKGEGGFTPLFDLPKS